MINKHTEYGNKLMRGRLARKARIDFLKWGTLVFPYIKGVCTAKEIIWRLFKELFLMCLSGRCVIVNHPSGKVHYFEKLSQKEYIEARRKLIEMIFDQINYIRYAKKQIRCLETEV